MFQERLANWARVLNLFTATMSTIMAVRKARISFGRNFESTTQARNFERELIERKAYSETLSRLPVAR